MKTVLDTTEFSNWAMKKYNISNGEWHEKIWRPFMCDYFMDSNSSVGFSKFENPENTFEEHMNEFIAENSQFGNTIWMEFTN